MQGPRHEACSTILSACRPAAPSLLVPIAEDDPEAIELLQMLVEQEGCKTSAASDGALALALAMVRELPRPTSPDWVSPM